MRMIAAIAILVCVLVAVPAAAADRQVDDNLVPCVSGLPIHGTIGAAVAVASAGETILVCAGIYSENVLVNTADLTLQAQGVVHLNPENVNLPGITVNADGVTIQGFDISGFTSNCGVGVDADRADIRDNRSHGNAVGICVEGGTDHRVRYNVVQNNTFAGIRSQFTTGPVEISSNTVKNHIGGIGIELFPCLGGGAIDHNDLTGNFQSIVVDVCDGALITNNTVRGPGASTPGSRGIEITQSVGVVVTRNLVRNAEQGVFLVDATGATASFNSISFNDVGLDVLNTSSATVTRNNVSRSTTVDCRADLFSVGASVLTGNSCGTQQPAGAFD